MTTTPTRDDMIDAIDRYGLDEYNVGVNQGNEALRAKRTERRDHLIALLDSLLASEDQR